MQLVSPNNTMENITDNISHIQKLLENRIQKPVKIRGPRSPREELIEKFRQRLNQDRVGTSYKPLSYVIVLKKLEHISDEGLYHFYKDCERAKHFSKYFFYKLKV